MKIIGITGTNGKTTCVHLICNLLKDYINCASFGTLGIKHYRDNACFEKKTQLTTLGNIELHKNLLEVTENKCEFVAMEVSSHGLDQKRVAGVDFVDVVFTNLSHDHLDYHKTMENYFQAKLKLFTDYNNKLRRAIINLDDEYGLRLIKFLQTNQNNINNKLEIIGFSTKSLKEQSNESYFKNIKKITCEQIIFNNLGIQASISTPWGTGVLNTELIGMHNLSNLLASIAVCVTELPFIEILKKCSVLQPATGRLQKVINNLKNNTNIKSEIIVDYAHTPDGLEKALLAIKKHYSNKKICCIFGCGGDRDTAKRPKMLEMADNYCDTIILTQDNPRSEDPQKIIDDILSYKITKLSGDLIIEMDRRQAIYNGIKNYFKDHIILIAGKGHETKQIIGFKEYPFCDYTVAKEGLNMLNMPVLND